MSLKFVDHNVRCSRNAVPQESDFFAAHFGLRSQRRGHVASAVSALWSLVVLCAVFMCPLSLTRRGLSFLGYAVKLRAFQEPSSRFLVRGSTAQFDRLACSEIFGNE